MSDIDGLVNINIDAFRSLTGFSFLQKYRFKTIHSHTNLFKKGRYSGESVKYGMRLARKLPSMRGQNAFFFFFCFVFFFFLQFADAFTNKPIKCLHKIANTPRFYAFSFLSIRTVIQICFSSSLRVRTRSLFKPMRAAFMS